MSRITLAIALLLISAGSGAEYTNSCSLYAMTLSGAAGPYDSKLWGFKSACDSDFGYSKDDESACGENGYLRLGFKRAQRDLENAIDNVARYCGVGDQLIRIALQSSSKEVNALRKQKSALEGRVKELEAEVKRLKAAK